VLAIRNAFPFLTPGDDPDVRGKIRDGFGYHEIIIHSPDPDQDFEQFETAQTELVLEMYIRRYRELAAQPHIKHVQIFTNRGPESGASVRHPHSQIVAMPVVPSYVQRLVETAREFHQETGKDLAEDELTRERDRQERLVEESAHFIVYCPFAPHADYQVRILPKRTHHRFDQMTDEERTDLAGIINTTYRRLDRVAGIPPYNAFIRTAPVATKGEAGLSWHIDIIPHLSTPGGMELATGLDVITVAPEDAAAALRQDS
jgi:UDPglucose--hexose-1-phosphate uridylyltransferase